MISKETLQLYLDKKYPELRLQVMIDCRQISVLKISVSLETYFYLENTESLNHVESRLLGALSDAKKLIEHSVVKIKEDVCT